MLLAALNVAMNLIDAEFVAEPDTICGGRTLREKDAD
jgi:hypothetical protein